MYISSQISTGMYCLRSNDNCYDIKIKTNLTSENFCRRGWRGRGRRRRRRRRSVGRSEFGSVERIPQRRRTSARLFLNVRCVVPRGGIGLLAVNGGHQTVLFYTSALATLLFSSDSTEARFFSRNE